MQIIHELIAIIDIFAIVCGRYSRAVPIVGELVPFIDRSMLSPIFAIVCARYSWAVQILIDRILLLWILMADPVCLEMVAVVTADFSATRSGSHDAIEKAGHAEPNRNNQKHLEQRPRQRDRHLGGVGGGHATPSRALCI